MESLLIEYLHTEWLSPISGCPKVFLRCHTKHYFHIDETPTSRVEGAHHSLKKNLQTPKHDPFTVVQLLGMAIERQNTNTI